MSETKFTPGPWMVDPRFDRDIQTADAELEIACTNEHVLTGGVKPDAEQQRANARLIAAAPDLYEAAYGLLYSSEDVSTYDHFYSALRAALAKARGEA